MEVYDDRAEIINPGGLPKGMSLQDLGTVSIRRNELIADIFFRLHKVERIGMGIQKMKEAMAASGLREPVFEPNGFFRATFQRSPEFALKEGKEGFEKKFGEKSEELVERLVDKLVDGLAETQKKILQLIIEHPRISKKAMAEGIGISTTAIDKNLTTLKRRGLLRRIGPDKGGHWEVMHQDER